MDEEMNDVVVLVIDKGMITEAYSDNANQRIIIVDLDCRRTGEDSITELSWPETQFDDERVNELLGLEPDE